MPNVKINHYNVNAPLHLVLDGVFVDQHTNNQLNANFLIGICHNALRAVIAVDLRGVTHLYSRLSVPGRSHSSSTNPFISAV